MTFYEFYNNERKSDIEVSKEAISMYNKIIDLIENKKQSVFNLLFKGIKGIKLSQYFNDEKYKNLNLVFVPHNVIAGKGKSGMTANGQYFIIIKSDMDFSKNGKTNLNFPRDLRDFVTELGIVKPTFTHELSHILNMKESKGKSTTKKEYNPNKEDDLIKYANEKEEISAYLRSKLANVLPHINTFKSYYEFEKSIINDLAIWNRLTPENKKEVRKRLYTFWDEIK